MCARGGTPFRIPPARAHIRGNTETPATPGTQWVRDDAVTCASCGWPLDTIGHGVNCEATA
jgi:hypothetical protein